VPSTVEKDSPTRVTMVIEVPFGDLQPAIDKAYKQISAQINVPGFRRGHVPNRLIDQRYGRGAVLQEAINDALPKVYSDAVIEHELTPLGRPNIEVTKLEDGDVVEFTVKVDVRPDFEVPDLSTIAVTVDPVKVDEDDLQARLDRLRQRFATYTDLDRAAAKGDVVTIDLKATQDGRDIPDADAKGMTYVLGEGGLVDGLDEAVTGLSAGESATFSSELVGGTGKGEQADITVTVQKVQERHLPAVDDQFAQLVSEYDTADEMMTGLRDSLERMGRLDQAGQARDRMLDAVIAATSFDMPQQLLDDEVEARKKAITDQLSQSGLTIEDYIAANPDEGVADADEFFQQVAEGTEHGLRAQIILDKLAEDLKVEVSQEDLSALIMQKASENGTTPDEEAQHMVEHNHLPEYLGDIRRGKALGEISTKATVTDTDGNAVDLSRLHADGTLEPEAAAIQITEPKKPAKAADKPKAAKPKKKADDSAK